MDGKLEHPMDKKKVFSVMTHRPQPKPATPETNAFATVALGYGAIAFGLYKGPAIPVINDFITFTRYLLEDHVPKLHALHVDPLLAACLIFGLPFFIVGCFFTPKLAVMFDGQIDQRAERMSKRREKQRQRKQGRDNFVVRVP
jgi:hypothetical protein